MVEPVNESWVEPLLRTALALTGDPVRARRLTAQALSYRGDSRDAYFTLYRRFLSPFHRWPRSASAGRRSRREWAAVVGLFHDEWSDENVADLLGCRIDKVRRAAADASAQKFDRAQQEFDTDRALKLAELYRRRRSVMASVGAAGVLMAACIPSLLATGSQRTENPPPSPPYVRPTLAVGLPTGPDVAVRYAYRIADRYNETGHRDEWAVVTTSGERRVLAGLHGDFLKVSQNGLRIAHYDSEKSELTLMDVRGGQTETLPVLAGGEGSLTLDFSLDDRYIAIQPGKDPVVVMDLRDFERLDSYPEERIIGWTRRGLVTVDGIEENAWLRRPNGSKERTVVGTSYDTSVSGDGTMYAGTYGRRPKIRVENVTDDGTNRTINVKDDDVLYVERWVGSSAVIVSMRHGGYRLVDIKTGKARPIEIEDTEYSEVVFGKL
ncbi:hypothetical protein ACFYY8_36620 [Streptosporangium sp. NPDC001559]|uniref:hypothetical protein n=1 Tax=Streptosporangium sp. NPDC001559 TaxID=3366187 RepID=UPI0036E29E50